MRAGEKTWELLQGKSLRAAVLILLGTGLSLVIASGNISNTAAALFGLVFVWVAFTRLKTGIFLAIVFANFQPFFERLLLLASGGTFGGGAIWGNMFRTSVSLAILLLAAFAFGRKVVEKTRIFKFPLDKYIAVYLAWCLLQVFNPNQSTLIGIYGFKQELVPLLMYFLARDFFRTEEDLKFFFNYMIVYGTVSCGYALYQHFFLTSFDQLWVTSVRGVFHADIATGTGIRAFAFATGDMPFLFPLVAILIVVVALGRRFFNPWMRRTILLLYLCFALMTAFQLPRTPVLMLGLGLLVTSLLTGYIRGSLLKRLIFLGLAAIILVEAFVYFSPYLRDSKDPRFVRFAELANPMEADTVKFRRERPWKESLAVISRHPLGIGVGSGKRTRPGVVAGTYYLPHNEFLMKWLELGLPGLIFFILLLLKTATVAATVVWKGTQAWHRRYAAGILGVLAAYVACSMVNIPFLDESGIFFWFMAGVLPLIKGYEIAETG